jgi:multidrug resistance protein
MSPLTSSILAPSLPAIKRDLGIQTDIEATLCLSIFVLGFASGPLVLGPLSELYGRSIVLKLSNAFFAISNLACSFAHTKEQLIIFRLLAGIGGSTPLAIGPAVLSDLFTADERGKAVSIYTFFPLMGPALGPIFGGIIADHTSWRWCFWSTTIATIPVLLVSFLFLEETYPPVLLHRRKISLIEQTGNTDLFTTYDSPDLTIAQKLGDALKRPLKLMTTQIIVIVMGLYQAYLYGLMYIVLATFPRLWTEKYHQSLSRGGLNYLSLGLGYGVGIQISARVQDRVYAILKRRNNGVGLPEFRVPMMIPIAVILPLGFFLYGWTAQAHIHWIFPNIGAFIFAAGIMVGFNALMTYVVDSYPTYCASASAAISLLRSVAAFALPLSAPPMYDALGYGWGNSLLAFIAIGIGGPAPVLLWLYGSKLRARSTFASG